MAKGIAGQRVAITAGAGGIGLAIARMLHDRGAKVAISDVDADALAKAAAELGDCPAVLCDVADAGQVDGFFDLIADRLGGLDACVANAGIAGPTAPIEDISPEDWSRCLDVGLTGQFLTIRRAVPMLKAAGGGSVVCMSSVAGKHGYAFRTPYSASKFGVIGLAQSLAKELGPSNIRVNAILPGVVEGPRIETVIRARAEATGVSYEEMKEGYLSVVSMKRMVSMDDIAEAVSFLLSDAGRNVSGQSLAVDANVETL